MSVASSVTQRRTNKCSARDLCSKPSGEELCSLLVSPEDFQTCIDFNPWFVLYVNPKEIHCPPEHSRNCIYYGKRPGHCERDDGNLTCGTLVNGNDPEIKQFGQPPSDLLERIRKAYDEARR